MRLKKVAAVAMASTMVVSLAACGSNDTAATTAASAADSTATEAPADSKEETKADAEAADGEKITLSITTWDNESSPQFSAVVDAYEEKNPNVEIKVIDTSADEYNNSLGISLSAAQPDPDVIFVKDMGSMLQMAD